MGLYKVYNGASPTTAVLTGVATGTNIKTMLQIKLGGSTNQVGEVVAWGVSFNGSAAATPVRCELLTTGTVGATITEFVAADIVNQLDPNAGAVTDDFPLAFTASGDESGFTGTAEGTITATRILDCEYVAPTNQYIHRWELGNEPRWIASNFLRVRVHAPNDVTCVCWVEFRV